MIQLHNSWFIPQGILLYHTTKIPAHLQMCNGINLSVHEQVNKENVVQTCNELLFINYKKTQCHFQDTEWKVQMIVLSEITRFGKRTLPCFHSYVEFRGGKRHKGRRETYYGRRRQGRESNTMIVNTIKVYYMQE